MPRFYLTFIKRVPIFKGQMKRFFIILFLISVSSLYALTDDIFADNQTMQDALIANIKTVQPFRLFLCLKMFPLPMILSILNSDYRGRMIFKLPAAVPPMTAIRM